MTCAACLAAQSRPTIDQFEAGCVSCLARALAATGADIESAEQKRMTPRYRGALESLFGEAWQEGHKQVKAWAKRMPRKKPATAKGQS